MVTCWVLQKTDHSFPRHYPAIRTSHTANGTSSETVGK